MSDEQSIFFDEWQACLHAHYTHVIRQNDRITEPTLHHVLLQTGMTEAEIQALRQAALGGEVAAVIDDQWLDGEQPDDEWTDDEIAVADAAFAPPDDVPPPDDGNEADEPAAPADLDLRAESAPDAAHEPDEVPDPAALDAPDEPLDPDDPPPDDPNGPQQLSMF